MKTATVTALVDAVDGVHVPASREHNTQPVVDGSPQNITSPTNAADPLLPLESMQDEDMVNKVLDTEPPVRKRGVLQSVAQLLSGVIPPGGLLSTVFNLSSICIGAGIVGLPAAAKSSGLVMAALYPVIIALLAVYSLFCLAVQMERLNSKTYESMARTLLGRGFDYFTAGVRLFNTFGGCVAFIIAVGNIFTAILENMDVPEYWKSRSGSRLMTSLLWLVVLLPLVIPRHVNSLRYVSAVGVGFIVYFVVMVVVHSCMNGLSDNVSHINVSGNSSSKGVHLFGTGNKAIDGLGVFMFAFICQVNSFEVYWDMAERSARRFTLYSTIAMVVCLLLYFLTACFGYLDFGDSVEGSVLLMYDPVREPAMMVAYLGVLVKLCASFPLLTMASRNGIYYIVGWDVDTLPFWKHCVVVVVLAGVTLLCGLFIPNVGIVFGFVGAICGGTLAFIFPAIFMMYGGNWSLRSVGWGHYLLTYTLMIAGVVVMVFGTAATIYGVVVVDK